MKEVLLDANIIIAAFDNSGNTSAEGKRQAKELINSIVQSDQKIVITNLIKYEVMRGISWKNTENYEYLVSIVNGFKCLNINDKIADLAIKMFRYNRFIASSPQNGEQKIDKYNFDIFHFSTAKIYKIAIKTCDTRFSKYEQWYTELFNA
jgi:predicted nucleic acid-binding protein